MVQLTNILNHPISALLELTIVPWLIGFPWDWLFDDHNGLQRTPRVLRSFRQLLYGLGHIGIIAVIILIIDKASTIIESLISASGLNWLAAASLVSCSTSLILVPLVLLINYVLLNKLDIRERSNKGVFH